MCVSATQGLKCPFLCFPEDRWSSYCLSSLAAQNICTSKSHWLAAPVQADLAGSLGSTSCCSLLRGLSSGWSTPPLPAPVCNPSKAVFTVDAKTTEVCASVCDPAVSLGSVPSTYNLKQRHLSVSGAMRKGAGSTYIVAKERGLWKPTSVLISRNIESSHQGRDSRKGKQHVTHSCFCSSTGSTKIGLDIQCLN